MDINYSNLLNLQPVESMEALQQEEYELFKTFCYDIVKTASQRAKLDEGMILAHVIECEDCMALEFLTVMDLTLFKKQLLSSELKLLIHLETVGLIVASTIVKLSDMGCIEA